jgi:adenylosuccinate lyase
VDVAEIEHRLATLRARGVKGTTGTQASFLTLFKGDHAKVRRLDEIVARKMGFESMYPVTGQTYTRKIDSQAITALSGVAQSTHKAATDLRLLASRKEIEEPFEADQIGSSAMAYKRNPMRAERICGLARFVMSLASSAVNTAATQWMERTLDDSANRRLVIPQAFLAIDAILNLYQNIAEGMVVYPNVIARNLQEELPFMATENILMAGVAAGGDRQDLHERIRRHSVASAEAVKSEGKRNDLLDRLSADPAFSKVDIKGASNARQFVGRAPEQVDDFLAEVIQPVRERYTSSLKQTADVRI